MKVVKTLLIGMGIIIALPFIIALFLKNDYAIEREITIAKPNDTVFNYIKFIKNQNYYSKWNMTDPNMKQTYRGGADGTVGFVSAWDSKNKQVGVGEQEITKIEEGKRIEMKLRFKVPFEAEDNAYMSTEMIDSNSTKVKWGFTGSFPYPMNIMQLFMDMDKTVGADLEIGLKNLKGILDK